MTKTDRYRDHIFYWTENVEDGGWARKSGMSGLVVPFWSIVFPLTLLSAYLLLSKPRPAKPPAQQPT